MGYETVKPKPATCPRCKAIHPWIMVQYGRWPGRREIDGHPCHVDGWSELKCKHCDLRLGAWTGNVLEGTFEEGAHEPPYGGEHRPGCKFTCPQLRLVAAQE